VVCVTEGLLVVCVTEGLLVVCVTEGLLVVCVTECIPAGTSLSRETSIEVFRN
jgi:hypothetical protein